FITFEKVFSKISAVSFMETGMIAHPVLVAIFRAPSRNGSILSSSPLLRVPSGNTQIEIPFLISSIAWRIVFSPSFGFLRSRNRQCTLFIQEVSVRRSEEHTSELQSRFDVVCRLLLDPP